MINARQNSHNSHIAKNDLFEQSEICLVELSDSGTVLYYRTNSDVQLNALSANAVGSNFYDDVAPFENIDELRLLVNRFVKSNYATEKFTFTCRIKNKTIPAKIMLLRVNEQSGGERGKTTIVDIRKI